MKYVHINKLTEAVNKLLRRERLVMEVTLGESKFST
jgi:hypothetical protein